mgnify:CR=1 FL=1
MYMKPPTHGLKNIKLNIMSVIRRDHTIYDIFDTYEEEKLNAYEEFRC